MEICGDYKVNNVPKEILDNFSAYAEMMPRNSKGEYERKFEKYFKELCPTIPDDAMDLLAGLLDLNPKTRLSCSQALKHPFF